MSPDRHIDQFAARQYGAFALTQARLAGMTDTMIQRRLESGGWLRAGPSVYVLASSPPKWERKIAVAVLGETKAFISGSTAAVLHGFDGFRQGRPEVTVPAGVASRSSNARIGRSIWFDEIATTRRFGFQTATEAETMLVLAGRVSPERLEALLDDRIASGGLQITEFDPILSRIEGARVRGSVLLSRLLADRSETAWTPSGNELERFLDRLVDHPDVPAVSRQHPFRDEAISMIVDRFISRWKLILEADGRRWHTRRADFERDRARDNAAAARGLAVLRFTWRMLTQDFEGCRRTLLDTGRTRAGAV